MKALSILAALSCLIMPPGFAAEVPSPPFPPAPSRLLYDEPKVIGAPIKTAIENLLVEHQLLAGQQVIIALLKGAQNGDRSEQVHQLFLNWKVGEQNNNDESEGILLVVFWNDQTIQVDVGYGLESILPKEKLDEITSQYILPELKKKNPQLALAKGAYRILEALESPLISSGKAIEILQEGNVSSDDLLYEEAILLEEGYGWQYFVIFGVLALVTSAGAILYKIKRYRRDSQFCRTLKTKFDS